MAPVLVRREGVLGWLTLDRPEALNALSPAMIRTLTAALAVWEHDDQVRAVLLDGAGTRGLCAGGDVRFLYGDRGGHASAVLLAEEYRLDARIAHYPKPYVALMDGLVMGGGVGVSAHGSVRVVTERTRLAMPEVAIGNMPDVGGTHLLAQAPGELGPAHRCGRDRLRARRPARARPTPPPPGGALRTRGDPATVAEFALDPGPSPLAADRDWIDTCYAADDAREIVHRLRADGRTQPADAIEAASPIAVVLTLRALRTARGGTLEQALEREYTLLRACLRWPDFREGVRAKLIDRDGTPAGTRRRSPPSPTRSSTGSSRRCAPTTRFCGHSHLREPGLAEPGADTRLEIQRRHIEHHQQGQAQRGVCRPHGRQPAGTCGLRPVGSSGHGRASPLPSNPQSPPDEDESWPLTEAARPPWQP